MYAKLKKEAKTAGTSFIAIGPGSEGSEGLERLEKWSESGWEAGPEDESALILVSRFSCGRRCR